MIRALVFDFDGLILDTETPLIDSYEQVYHRHSVPFDRTEFLKAVGQADYKFDPWRPFVAKSNQSFQHEDLEGERRKIVTELQVAQPILPGIQKTIQDAFDAGYHLGVASNSTHAWVDENLERLHLREFFEVVRCRDDVPKPKPSPDLYLSVISYFGIAATDAIALEDSAHGAHAAKAAGLWCVAIPNPSTRHHDLSHADLIIESLEKTPLDKILPSFGG